MASRRFARHRTIKRFTFVKSKASGYAWVGIPNRDPTDPRDVADDALDEDGLPLPEEALDEALIPSSEGELYLTVGKFTFVNSSKASLRMTVLLISKNTCLLRTLRFRLRVSLHLLRVRVCSVMVTFQGWRS